MRHIFMLLCLTITLKTQADHATNFENVDRVSFGFAYFHHLGEMALEQELMIGPQARYNHTIKKMSHGSLELGSTLSHHESFDGIFKTEFTSLSFEAGLKAPLTDDTSMRVSCGPTLNQWNQSIQLIDDFVIHDDVLWGATINASLSKSLQKQLSVDVGLGFDALDRQAKYSYASPYMALSWDFL